MTGVAKLPRPPQMRGLCASRMKLHMGIITLIGAAASFSWYQFWMVPKYRRYAEHFANYDGYKIMKEVCKKNLLHACPENLAKMMAEK